MWLLVEDSCGILLTSLDSQNLAIHSEINNYLNDPKEPKNTNVLDYWQKIGQFKYPYIKLLAQYYLSIPATQVNSERLFSTTGQIVSDRHTLLLPGHVE